MARQIIFVIKCVDTGGGGIRALCHLSDQGVVREGTVCISAARSDVADTTDGMYLNMSRPRQPSTNKLFLEDYYSKYFSYANAVISLQFTKTVTLHQDSFWAESVSHVVRPFV